MTDVARFVDTEKGLIYGEIFHNREIYEEELRLVFARSWLFLAHDAMIPKAGDFIQTYMGEDPVIVARQADGSVRAFMNQCRHQGMRICRADLGNTKTFMCSFHGWTYDTAGNLIHVPHENEAYTADFDKKDWGPIQVSRLANYKGFIFGCWDAEAPDFEEYLGDAKWYLDAYWDRYDGGLVPVASHKWVVPGNWKFNAEQPAGDAYHTESTHASAFQLALGFGGKNAAGRDTGGYQFTTPYGHGGGFRNRLTPANGPLSEKWTQEHRAETVARIGERRTDFVQGSMLIFPNLMLLPGTIRVTHPRGPHEMEMWSWVLAPAAAPDDVQREILEDVSRAFSPAGLYEQDDSENWVEEQRILRGHVARNNPLLYSMQLGTERYDADGLPGRTVPFVYAEEGARGLYRHWANLMSGRSWPDIVADANRREGRTDASV